VGVLNVLVEKEQSTGIDLQVRIRHFKLLISEKTELILNELHSLLDALEILSKGLPLLTLL
jgi:hypothetical protein